MNACLSSSTRAPLRSERVLVCVIEHVVSVQNIAPPRPPTTSASPGAASESFSDVRSVELLMVELVLPFHTLPPEVALNANSWVFVGALTSVPEGPPGSTSQTPFVGAGDQTLGT